MGLDDKWHGELPIPKCCDSPYRELPRGNADATKPADFCCIMKTPEQLPPGEGGHSCCLDVKNVNIGPGGCEKTCPCEGCCDFNCCDELDYFMHVAYAEAYSNGVHGDIQPYGSYEEFFNDWYGEFYAWWNPLGKETV